VTNRQDITTSYSLQFVGRLASDWSIRNEKDGRTFLVGSLRVAGVGAEYGTYWHLLFRVRSPIAEEVASHTRKGDRLHLQCRFTSLSKPAIVEASTVILLRDAGA